MNFFDAIDTSLDDRDFALVDGDLALTDGGDLESLSGTENVDQAMRRRLALRKGAAASLVFDVEGLWVVNGGLGNNGYSRLSEPGNGLQLSGLRQDAIDCLSEEDRIVITDVGARLMPSGLGFVSTVDIDHVYSSGEPGSVSVQANQVTGALEVQ